MKLFASSSFGSFVPGPPVCTNHSRLLFSFLVFPSSSFPSVLLLYTACLLCRGKAEQKREREREGERNIDTRDNARERQTLSCLISRVFSHDIESYAQHALAQSNSLVVQSRSKHGKHPVSCHCVRLSGCCSLTPTTPTRDSKPVLSKVSVVCGCVRASVSVSLATVCVCV